MSKTTPSTAQTPAAPSEGRSDSRAALEAQLQAAEARLAASARDQADLNQALTEARLTAHARETRILEVQVELRILESARDAALARLETARAEVLTLTRLLAQSEPRAGGDLAPETFARTLDRQAQQLEAQTREMAELTRLLAQSEQQTRALQKARDRIITWLPELMEALLQGAGTADPAADGARLEDADYAECARRLIATGAFDPDHYLSTNPDVAESGTDPARHFVQYGLTEGRAPRDLTQPRQVPASDQMPEQTPEEMPEEMPEPIPEHTPEPSPDPRPPEIASEAEGEAEIGAEVTAEADPDTASDPAGTQAMSDNAPAVEARTQAPAAPDPEPETEITLDAVTELAAEVETGPADPTDAETGAGDPLPSPAAEDPGTAPADPIAEPARVAASDPTPASRPGPDQPDGGHGPS